MNTRELSHSLTALFSELVDGAPTDAAYMLAIRDCSDHSIACRHRPHRARSPRMSITFDMACHS